MFLTDLFVILLFDLLIYTLKQCLFGGQKYGFSST